MSNITQTTWFAYIVLILMLATFIGLVWFIGPLNTVIGMAALVLFPYIYFGVVTVVDYVIDKFNLWWNKAGLPTYG